MSPIAAPPGFLINLLTFGIVRARWISRANAALNHRTGSLFAYFLQPFANYGLASRLNVALAELGSKHTESPLWCFLLTGWPFIGANKRMRRGTKRLNDAMGIRAQVEQPILVG